MAEGEEDVLILVAPIIDHDIDLSDFMSHLVQKNRVCLASAKSLDSMLIVGRFVVDIDTEYMGVGKVILPHAQRVASGPGIIVPTDPDFEKVQLLATALSEQVLIMLRIPVVVPLVAHVDRSQHRETAIEKQCGRNIKKPSERANLKSHQACTKLVLLVVRFVSYEANRKIPEKVRDHSNRPFLVAESLQYTCPFSAQVLLHCFASGADFGPQKTQRGKGKLSDLCVEISWHRPRPDGTVWIKIAGA
jgi:hypothetical protein